MAGAMTAAKAGASTRTARILASMAWGTLAVLAVVPAQAQPVRPAVIAQHPAGAAEGATMQTTGQTTGSAAEHRAPKPQGLRWRDLSAEQRELLSDVESHWDRLPRVRQDALAHAAQRWLSLPEQERAQARQRLEHWKSLDADQRRELRRRYHEFKELPAGEQERIRQNFDRFQHLSPEQRREMRDRFRSLAPEERQRLKEQWHRHPGAGRHGPPAHGRDAQREQLPHPPRADGPQPATQHRPQ